MKIDIPKGVEINQTENNVVKIRVPNTNFWVLGEQLADKTWNAYLYDPQTNYKESIKKKATTKSFALFSGIILKTPFPINGKKAQNSKIIKKFLKQITK